MRRFGPVQGLGYRFAKASWKRTAAPSARTARRAQEHDSSSSCRRLKNTAPKLPKRIGRIGACSSFVRLITPPFNGERLSSVPSQFMTRETAETGFRRHLVCSRAPVLDDVPLIGSSRHSAEVRPALLRKPVHPLLKELLGLPTQFLHPIAFGLRRGWPRVSNSERQLVQHQTRGQPRAVVRNAPAFKQLLHGISEKQQCCLRIVPTSSCRRRRT